ncbi:MAG: hypothetical protein K8S16_14475 [Bacteroidales bacterium]|nr:hypothetical protein [Bacteroidales bacterium]
MKIVAINRSHTGKRGYTHFLIEKLFKGAKQEGAVCEEITLAGKELVTKGKISKKKQKTASQDIIPVPFFSILKNFRWFKKKALAKLKIG